MRVVLDTNVVVSALLFRDGALTPLRYLWRTGQFLPLVDRPCTEELLRVSSYPKFGLGPGDITALLEDYLPFAETVRPRRVRVPRCRDEDDRKFLALAVSGSADALVSGDRATLALADRTRFAIESPAEFLARFTEG